MRSAAAAFLLAFLLLAGCGGAPVRPGGLKAPPGKTVVREAKALMGTQYKYGGRDPRTGFDCSGLVYYIYRKHGARPPRSTRDFFKAGRPVAKKDLKPGDLVFFDTMRTKPGHMGIYSGGGRFVHAPSSGGRVREDELVNNYWRKAWYGARRLD